MPFYFWQSLTGHRAQCCNGVRHKSPWTVREALQSSISFAGHVSSVISRATVPKHAISSLQFPRFVRKRHPKRTRCSISYWFCQTLMLEGSRYRDRGRRKGFHPSTVPHLFLPPEGHLDVTEGDGTARPITEMGDKNSVRSLRGLVKCSH